MSLFESLPIRRRLPDKVTPGESLPLYAPVWWPYATIPSNCIQLYGQALSRFTYSAYFKYCGTTHGAGDGSNTFNAPDMRGRINIGLDNMGGSGASRITSASTNGTNATTLGGAGGGETHQLTVAQLPQFVNNGAGSISKTIQSGASGITAGSGTGYTGGSSSYTLTNGSDQAHSNTQPWVAGYWIARMY